MHDFLAAFLGGLLLGLSVVGYLYVNGRIAGVSGLVGQYLIERRFSKLLRSGFSRTIYSSIYLRRFVSARN